MVNGEIERRLKEEEAKKRKEEKIAKETWTDLFNTSLMDRWAFNQLLIEATEEIKNSMKNPKHGFSLTQNNNGYDKLIKGKDGKISINNEDQEGNRSLKNTVLWEAGKNAMNQRKSLLGQLYTASERVNNCQTRAATVANLLLEANALRGTVSGSDHICEFTCTREGRIYVADQKGKQTGNAWRLEEKNYNEDPFWEKELAPLLVWDDIKNSEGAIKKHGENHSGKNSNIPAGIYEMALSRFLLEKKPEVGEEFLQNMLDDRKGIWAFCQLPGLTLEETETEKNGKKGVRFLLLSGGQNSFMPGQENWPENDAQKDENQGQKNGKKEWTMTKFLSDYTKMINPKNSCYKLDFVTLIKNLDNELWEDDEKEKALYPYLLNKFPHSKILYINGEYCGKRADDDGVQVEEQCYKKSIYDWMNNAVDGKFVLGEESLANYIKREGWKN